MCSKDIKYFFTCGKFEVLSKYCPERIDNLKENVDYTAILRNPAQSTLGNPY
jgi:hypothetical protein